MDDATLPPATAATETRQWAARRYLPFAAVLAVVVLSATDWPLGWGFWVEHPLGSALAAGVAIVVLTGSVIDAYLQRKEARRWAGVGRAASVEFAGLFTTSCVALAHVLALDLSVQLDADIQFHLAGAAERAAELLDQRDLNESVLIVTDPERYGAVQAERLPALVVDRTWRDMTLLTLDRLATLHVQAIARWSSIFAILEDEARFNHVTASLAVLDQHQAVREHLLEAQSASDVVLGSLASVETVTSGLVQHWNQLTRAYNDERLYWYRQKTTEAAIDHLGAQRLRARPKDLGTDLVLLSVLAARRPS